MNYILRSTTYSAESEHVYVIEKRRHASWLPAVIATPGFMLMSLSSTADPQIVGIAPPAATELPTNGKVVAGSATITQSGATMDINQTTQKGVIDWQTFNVGSQAQVNFYQPNSSSVTLNRVFDTQASQIFGHINATGQVFLTNPNGVFFSSSSTADVGGLVATTHSIGVDDFMAGNYAFNRNGSTASVVNQGQLHSSLGGYIALLAPEVRNEGVLVAKMGTVALASGEVITLSFDNNTLAGVIVEPSAIKALVENKGAVIAPGGTLILSAKALDHLQGGLINNSGELEATGLTVKDGQIVLEASDNVVQTAEGSMNVSGNHGGSVKVTAGQDVSISGNVNAQGLIGIGGDVTLSGNRVGVFDSALIDASGLTGGGNIFVGGGFHGQDPSISNAQQTVIGTGSTLKADAVNSGNGGNVAVWSTDFTNFDGSISARGGASNGNGGFVEVSGKNLSFTGSVNASSPNGKAGTLLLDPRDITVQSGGVSLTTDVDQFADTPSTDLIIDPNTIIAVTNTNTAVTLQANNDITVNNAIVTSGGGTGGALTFRAGRSITVNAAILSDNGNISFTANDSGADSNRVASSTANFNNNSVIDAGSADVSITMGTYADTSGVINTGHVAGHNLTVTHNGPTAGAVSGAIDLGQTDLTNNLTITANSARNVTNTLGTLGAAGNVVVRGTASISVGTGDVTINGSNTDFNIIGLTAGNVLLKDANAVRFATTTLSGNLSETTYGPIASTGAVQVTGTTTLTANNGGFGYADPYIDLTNGSNHFTGNVTLSVPSTGATGTGGYAYLVDSGAITIASSNTQNYLRVQAGGNINVTSATSVGSALWFTTSTGAINTTTLSAGDWIQLGTSSGTVNTTTTTAGSSLTVSATGAIDLGTTTVGNDLTVNTNGAITDSGVITVPRNTSLTAGSGNDITFDSANNDFTSVRIVSSRDATFVDKNAFNFGSSTGGGAVSHVYRDLSVTAKGDITQTGYASNDGYSQTTVDGATTFTANNASSQINLYLGPNDPFTTNGCCVGQSNSFAGTVTLARNNVNTGFSNVQLRNSSSSASVLAGLTSVGSLNNVYLKFDNAPSVSLPGMTLAGDLKVYAPGVVNTASTPTNIISQTGAIVVAGSTFVGAGSTGDIVLTNASNNFNQFGVPNINNSGTAGARDVSVVDTNAIVLYTPGYHQYVSRNYSVTAGGNISDAQYQLVIPGTATFSAGSGDITITGTNDYWNVLKIPSANNVTIYPQNSLVLDNIAITGSLNLQSRDGGTLTQNASTSVVTGSPSSNTTTFATFNSGITLNQSGNVFGNLAITNAGAINIRENDAITQASAWTNWGTSGGNTTRYAVTLATSNDQAITVNQSGNVFGDLIITQINNGSSSPGNVSVKEDSDSIYGLTQGGAWTVHGTTKIDTGNYSINLNNGSNVFGPMQVIGGNGSTNGAASVVTIYAKSNGTVDAITDVGGPGAWNAGNNSGSSVRLVAYDGSGTAGAGNVNLTNTSNVLGDLYVKSTAATITENDSITDGDSTSWNSQGNTGWLTTGATNFIVANPTGKSIALDNLTNQLGPISINTTGTAGTLSSVLITDNTNMTQSAAWLVGTAPVTLDSRNHSIDLSAYSNVLGNVTITTANGTPTSFSLKEDDAITQGSDWIMAGVPVTLVAQNNKAITLTNASNVMGNLTVTGGAVSITENDNITQSSAWTTTGTTTLNAATNAITLTNTGNVLGNLAIAGAPSAVSITENDNITQASAWVQASTPFTLNANGVTAHDIILSQANNQLGDLTLTAQNATVVETDAAGITDGNAWTVPGTTTLTAGSANPIVLNANPASDLGTVSIVSASNADINDVNGIIFGASTIASGGVLTVTSGGAITQSGAITAPSLRLIGTGSGTLNSTSNNVQNLAAGFSGGNLSFTNDGDFAVAVIGGTSGITIGAHNVALTSATGTITGLSTVNASTNALTITTGTGLSLPQMSIAGPQSYTASTVSGSGITLTASVNGTASGAIDFFSPVTLGADLTVQSTNSNITFHSTVAGGTNQLTVNAGTSTGIVDFQGAVTALGDTGDAGAALNLTSAGATFETTLAANNGLAVTGPVTFKDNVTLANGNAGSVFAGQVTLGKIGGMNLSGYDGMSFNGGVVLQNGPTVINSNNSTLTFQNATVHGPYDLTLNSGTQLLTGLDQMGTDLTSLTVTALNPTISSSGISIAGPQSYTATSGSSITLNGNVTSTAAGSIIFNSPVVVGANTTIATSNSGVTFASTLDGNRNLTVSTGSGTKTFTGAVGVITPLGSGTGAALILQGSGASTFSNVLDARSGMTSVGAVIFNDDVTLTNGDTGSAFTGLVTTGGADGNTISGFDGLAFNGGLALVGGPVSVLSNGSTISFGNTVSGAQNLTLSALLSGAGTITGLDQIGFTSDLTALTLIGQTLSLPSTGLAVTGPMSFTAAGGITLNGNVGNTSGIATGQIDFNSPVTLATGAITIANDNAAVNFASTLNGARALTINNGSGTTTFTGVVGGSTPLTSLTTDATGTTAINGGALSTSGAQTYNDAVTLGAATTLNGVGVTFNSTLNGANTLTVNDSGTTTFAGIVGGSTPLTSLTTNAAGAVAINTTAITTSGGQTYNDAVTLGANVTFTGAPVTFNNTVDGAHTLTASATGSTVSLNGVVGGINPLTSVTLSGNSIAADDVFTSGTQNYTAVIGTTLNGDLTTVNNNVTITGPTVLGADVIINTDTGIGNITFSGATSTINGAHNLTLTAGAGNVVLGGVVGGITPLTGITITGNNLTLPGINTVGDLNQSYSALNDLTLNQSRTLNAPISFTADSDGDGNGSFILPTGISLTASNNALSITAADLDLQGSSTLSSGSGLMTITASGGRNLSLGGSDAAGQMTITGSELSRMTSSGGLDLKTSGAGWIHVEGIASNQSQNITGVLSLKAQGTGAIEFLTSPSVFNRLTANATGGSTNVAVDLSTNNAQINFVTPVAIAGASTIDSGGGNITFQSTVNVDNDLTLTTSNGALTFNGDVGSNKTLVLNLGGGSVTGLGHLQNTLTGLTVNSSSGITLPAFTINGPQVYNTGVITARGDLGGIGLTFNNVVNVSPLSGSALTFDASTGTLQFNNLVSMNANDVTMVGNEINFTNAVTGSGNLVLRPALLTRNMAIGGSGAPIVGLNLTATDIGWLPIGTLASITFGNSTGSGTLDVAGVINAPGTALILNGPGGITQSGGAVTSGALTLLSGAGIVLNNASNNLGAISISGLPTSINIADSTDITQGAAWVVGTAPVTLNAGAGTKNITLTQANNTFGTLNLTGTTVQVTEAASTDLGAITANALTVRSTGAISTSGTVAVSGLGDFKTLNNAGANITIANGSTFGSINAASRNAADNANASGNISLSLADSTLLKVLATTGDITLTGANGKTFSQDGTSTLSSGGLELLGAGATHDLRLGTNAITTLAGNTGIVKLVENSGFDIGTVNTVGLTTSGNTTLSTTGTVTQSQLLAASGLELLGVGGTYSLMNTGNAITTLAGNTGVVSFLENSGFAIGTVNTVGLTTSGNTTLSSTGTVTQSQALAADGVELLGAGGTFTLTNSGNAITTLAGSTGVVSFKDNSGFDIGTVNTVGLTTSGNTTLSTTGTVTQSQLLAASGLELLGTGGTYTLTNTGNAITTLAGNTGAINFLENSGFAIGTVNTVGLTATGNTTLSSTGTVTQSQALAATGLELLGAGGVFTLTNTGNAITTLAGNTGTVSLTENSGFAIGTVNTVGLTTSGDATLSTTGVVTQSALLAANGLELLGTGGTFTLTNTNNAITTLAGDTGTVNFKENSGFDIGTVNTVGLTTSGNTTLSSTGTVTQSQALIASGLELLGTGGTYTLTNTGNAITTLAGSTGSLSLVENSGFAIGTVNTAGLTTSGNTTLSSTGTVTQSQALTADGLELLGVGGVFTLTNTGNAITTLAADTGTISIRDNSGFDVGTVNTVGLTTSGDATLASTGTVTQSQAITASGLELLGTGGTFTLTNANNAITTLAGDTGTVSFKENSGFDVGTVNTVGLTTSGNTTLSSTGTVTQSQALAATGLELLGVGGTFTLTDSGNAITTLAGNTGTVSFKENSGFAIGTVNTVGLTTSGNTTLSSTALVTQSQALTATGLELLGAGGAYVLTNAGNAINTLAGNTGNVSFKENSGFAIGTVNTIGLTTSSNTTLSSTGTVTESQAIHSAGLELLGAGTFTLTNTGNAINTLAGNIGSLSFLENSGFAIGTVNTVGLTTSGNTTLSSTGAVTQSQLLAATGLELLGAGGDYTLNNTGNAITTLAANTGNVRFTDNSGYAIGTVNTTGLTTTGIAVLSTTGTVTQSQNISTAGLGLLGTGGTFTLTRDTNTIPLLAADTGNINVHTSGAIDFGTVNPIGITASGDVSVKANGAITQSQPLVISGNLTLETTDITLGDVAITNIIPSASVLGETSIGGDYVFTATGKDVSQYAGSNLQVAGDLSINAATLTLGGAANLVGGTTTTPSVAELRQSGVIHLGDITTGGNYSVISVASNKTFGGAAVHGTAITLNDGANNIGGYIAVKTAGPSVNSGADVQTGIDQQGGTTINIGGVASFTAENSSVGGSGFITLNNTGNAFGSLVLSGKNVSVTEDTGATIVNSANASTNLTLVSSGSVTQIGAIVTPALSVTGNGLVTLNNVGNNVSTVAITSNGNNIVYTDADGFDIATVDGVTGIVAGGATVSLTAGGSGNITQSSAVTGASTLSVNAGGSIDLDQVAVSNTIGALGTVSAGTGIEIADSAGGIAINGNIQSTSGNISVVTSGGDLTIADTRTITANGSSNIYLAAGPGYNFINNDSTPLTPALVLGSGRFIIYSKSNSGTVKGGLTGSEYMGETYALNGPATQGGRSGNLFLYNDAATLLFTADNLSRVYGSNNPTLTYTVTGFLSGDNAASSFSGDPTLSTGATSGSNVGSYAITIGIGTLSSLKGYLFQFGDGALSVNPYVVNLTGTRVYNGNAGVAAANLNIGSLVGSETLTLSGSGTMADKNVGTGKSVGIGTLALGDGTNGGLASNYTLVGGTRTVDITQAPLTISTSNITKTYNGALSGTGTPIAVSGTQLFGSDTLTGGTYLFTNANVGSGNKTVNVSAVTVNDGNSGGNYSVSYASNTTSTINPASITISTSDITKTYNGTLTAIGTPVVTVGTLYTNASNSNTLDSLSGGTYSFTNANAGSGNKTVTVSGVTVSDGNSGNNYTVTYADNTTSTINKANITVSTGNVTKTYDGTTSATGSVVLTAGTLYNNVSNSNILDSISGGTFAFTNANAGLGNKAVTTTAITVTDGNSGNNYNVSYADNTTSTINPYVVNLTGTRAYDGTTNITAGVLNLGTLVGSETLVLTGTGTVVNKNVGTGKAVSIGSLALSDGTNGGLASNYTLTGGTRTVDITAAALTLSTTNVTKTYDGNTSASGTATVLAGTLFSGDTLSGGSFAFTNPNAGIGNKSVTASGVTVNDGNSGNNYSVSYANNTTSTINPYAVNLTGTRAYDGSLNAPASALVIGSLVGSETLTLTGTGAVANKNVGNSKTITLGSLALGDGTNGGLASNYTFTGGTQTMNITAAPLTITTSDVVRPYNGTLSAAGTAVVGSGTLFGGDSLSGGTFAFTNANAGIGNKSVTTSGVTVNDGNSGNNYSVSYANNTTSTINPAALTISTSNVIKTYDGTTSAAGTAIVTTGTLYTNVSNGNTLDALSGGTFAYSNANVGSGNKTVTTSGVTVIDGNSGNNYAITYADNTASTIIPYVVNLSGARTYDGTTTVSSGALTIGTLVGSETLMLTGSGTMVDKHVGNGKTVTIGGLALANGTGLASNYTLVGGTRTVNITPAALTLSTSNVTKTYNGTLSALGTAVAVSGTQVFSGDSLSGGTFAFTNPNAGIGNKVVTTGGVTVSDGNSGNNYTVTYANNTTSTINPASISVGTTSVTKTYDGSVAANGTAILTSGTLYNNVSNGNALDSLSGGTFNYTNANAGTGNKVVTTSGVLVNDGNSGNNYAITYVNNTTSTINRAALTVVPTANDKTYDGNNVATIGSYGFVGLVGSETVNATYTATFSDKNADTGKVVSISGITLQDGSNGGLAANYTAPSTASTTASILPKSITFTATIADKVYDSTTAATLSGYTLSGLVGSETLNAAAGGSANFADKNVGNGKTVTVTGITLLNGTNGGLASNYSVTGGGTGIANITPATLNVAGVVAIDKVYDGTTAANVNTLAAQLTGVLGADDVHVGTITGTFASKNVGNAIPVTGSAFVLTGNDSTNYNLVQPTGLVANITPRTLVIGAVGVGKVYDGNTSASATLSDNRIIGDVLNISYNASFLDKNAGIGKFVNVSGITISGTDAGNYVANSTASAFATISPRVLTVVATGNNKVYDATTSATVRLADNRLTNDVLTLSYGSAVFADKNVGNGKAVTVNGLTATGADAGNYSISATTNTTANVTPATLVVTATGNDKTYDGNTSATVVLSDNHLGNDIVSLLYNNASFADKNAGVGKAITVNGIALGGPDGGNYIVSSSGTTIADIAPLQLIVTATGVDKAYDGSNSAVVVFADNRLSGDVLNVGYGSAVFESETPGTGKTIDVSGIYLSGTDATNYSVASSTTATANIAPNNQNTTPVNIVVDYQPAVLNTTTSGANSRGSVVPAVDVPLQPVTLVNTSIDSAISAPVNLVGGGLRLSDTMPGVIVVVRGRSAHDIALGDIEVQLVSIPSTKRSGVIAVSVPEGSDEFAQGFSFPLPSLVAETAMTDAVTVTSMSGGPMPDWLHYVPATKTFVVSNAPAVVLPMQMQVKIGNQPWIIRIAKRQRWK